MRVDAVGGPYLFLGISERQLEFLAGHFRPLVVDGEESGAETPIRVFRVDERELIEVAGIGAEPWTFAMDLDPRPESLRFATRRMFGRIDWRPKIETAIWIPDGDDDERLGCFENALRLTTAYRLLETGGVLLHSAGILAGGRAWLFFGRSGAGKSTLSRLSAERGHQVLSDELNALLAVDGEPRLERMPFAGDYGRSVGPRASWPLSGAFALRQGGPPRRDSLPRGAAVSELAVCAPFVNGDPHRSAALLDTLERLTRAIEVEALTFGLDPGFWDILDASP